MSLSSQNKKKKKKTKTKQKKNKIKIWYKFLTIHKYEEYIPKKPIQIKSSNTIKVKTTNLSKYNPKIQVKIHCPSQPLATSIDENQIVDESKVSSYERLLINQTDLEASIKNRRSPLVNGPRQIS